MPQKMFGKLLTTEPPDIADNNFEDYLATDDLLVDYFNEFLSLPTFPEPVRFNKDSGAFEVVSDAVESLTNQIKDLLCMYKPKNPVYDVTRRTADHSSPFKPPHPPKDLNIDNSYSVMCLDREQGVQWIRKERLPLFLQSDCYFEYRLAKLLSQVECSSKGKKLQIDPSYRPWSVSRETSAPPTDDEEHEAIIRKFYVSLGQSSVTQTKEWFTLAKQSQELATTQSSAGPLSATQTYGHLLSHQEEANHTNGSSSLGIGSAGYLSNSLDGEHCSPSRRAASAHHWAGERPKSMDDNCFVSVPHSPSQTPSTMHLDLKSESGIESDSEDQEEEDKENRREEKEVNITEETAAQFQEEATESTIPAFSTLEDLATFLVNKVLRNCILQLSGEPESIDKTANLDHSHPQRVITVHYHAGLELSEAQGRLSEPQEALPTEDSKGSRKVSQEEESPISESENEEGDDDDDEDEDGGAGYRTYDFSSREGLERFKMFLHGTPGEKYWHLWMDIERLKVMKDTRRKISHLQKMKKQYLMSGGEYFLNTGVLSRLFILHASCWTEEHLCHIQPKVTEPLLLYWGPRMCMNQAVLNQKAFAKLKMWQERQLRPRVNIDPSPNVIKLLPLRAKSCVPKTAKPPSVQKLVIVQRKTSAKSENGPGAFVKKPWRLVTANLDPTKSILSPILSKAIDKPGVTKKWQRAVSARSMASWSSDSTDSSVSGSNQENKDNLSNKTHSSRCSPVLGGARMERMLQALHHDQRAGYFFTQFCELSGNKLWKNGVQFWFDLQDYHRQFYQENLNPFKLQRLAQFLYSTYVCFGAPMDIAADLDTRKHIYQRLDPPFEDLFDPAEEYILTLLLVPWMQMTNSDRTAYKRVELVEETRLLVTVHYRKLLALHKKTLRKQQERGELQPSAPSPPPPPEVPREPNLWEQVPEEYHNYNLSNLLRHRLELEHFRNFLEEHFASMDLMCWLDIEQFRRTPHKEKDKREEKSRDIKSKYLNKKYFFGPNSPATRDQQEQVMRLGGGWGKILHDRLSAPVLVEVQKHVRNRIERKWLPLFLSTPEFAERQKMQLKMKNVAEDQIFHTNRKKREVWKDLCHSHSDDSTIQSKVSTIINCFINSSIPPVLQIDIPPEQAEEIIEKRRELGPYVFREAQMTVFGILFKLWPDFCAFRSNLEDAKVLPALERKKEKLLEKLKRKIREEERRAKEQEEAKRKMSFSDNFFGDNESAYSGSQAGVSSTREARGPQSRSQQVSWSYSKYMEALEQERALLEMQNDLEGRTLMSSLSDPETSSIRSTKSAGTKRTLHSIFSQKISS
ncbi:regulator of G-protein signaling 22 isoform X5 [Polyodon spathula]|uniref:regulator of G-protein signaling 22 isoform X5 n=1 Tax=Polyodon spathula TaxID=7913 RepID=UPI001B7ED977|nr:regulator of G-protein signaling 22 isoform X5 [Polyodon spathula]